jgi:hypothetical protein
LPWKVSWGGSRWTRARTVSLLLLIVILLLGSLVVVVDVLRGEMGDGDASASSAWADDGGWTSAHDGEKP